MRILITNNTLASPEGSELYARDLALALLKRGHEVVAYSRILGDVASELRAATVPVVDDLEHVATPPDIIHGQHHLETMTALVRFPSAPAVYLCHGWLPPAEAPPRSPRILRYLAVDELVRQRLSDECGIAPARVEVHRNAVDLGRFPARAPLPRTPQRALVFSHEISDANCLPAVRAACSARGIQLDVAGRDAGAVQRRPEALLGNYDLVFAKARCALEAAAVGAAVVLCDYHGMGPLVTSAELDALRAVNFGVRLLREPVTAAALGREIDRYDADDAGQVSRRVRAEADLTTSVDRLEAVYRVVLSELAAAGPGDPDVEGRAHSAYLRWGPLTGGDFFGREREALLMATTRLRTEAEFLRSDAGRSRAEADAARVAYAAQAASAEAALDAATVELTASQAALEAAGATQAALADRLRAADEHAARLANELSWVTTSATWKFRERLLRHQTLVDLYLRLRTRRS